MQAKNTKSGASEASNFLLLGMLSLALLFFSTHVFGYTNNPCSLSSTGEYFTKADGHKIYLLFDRHQIPGETGPNFIQEKIDDGLDTDNQVKSYLETLLFDRRFLRAIVEKQSEEIKRLSENGKVTWVAWEGLPDNYIDSKHRNVLKQQQDQLDVTLRSYHVSHKTRVKIAKYIWGPVLDNVFARDTWAERLKIKAYDPKLIKDLQVDILNRANEIANEFLFSSLNPDISPENLEKILDISRRVDGPEGISREMIEGFELSFPGRYQQPVREWVNLFFEYEQIQLERDRIGASRLLSISGNGVLVAGGAHEINLIAELTTQCISSMD